MNIHSFFIKDGVNSGEVTIKYFPTGEMVADHFTKPLQVHLFRNFSSIVMNFSEDTTDSKMSWD